MPTQTELEFYKAFGIPTEEKFYCKSGYCKNSPAVKPNTEKCRTCEYGVYYTAPEITDRRLLELTVLANQIVNFDKNIVSVDELKDSVLDALIVSKALAKPEEASVKDTVREIMGVE